MKNVDKLNKTNFKGKLRLFLRVNAYFTTHIGISLRIQTQFHCQIDFKCKEQKI